MRAERKVVTALFADVVGSTALGEALDPEDVVELVGGAVSRMVLAAEAFGGTVQALTGDGILALFGAPQAFEDDAERAVRAALRIIKDVGDHAAAVAGGHELQVRVGIQTGLAVLGPHGAGSRVEYSATGDAINTAARLQSAARPGTVLVGAAAQGLVAGQFRWSQARSLELKGKTDAVEAYEVTAALDPVAVGPRSGLGLDTPLVGRDAELATLTRVMAAAGGGRGAAVVIVGDPGVGKTRLLAEARAGSPGVRWLIGRAGSLQTQPYAPLAQALESWLGTSELRSALQDMFGASMLDLYPYLGAILEVDLDPEAAARLNDPDVDAVRHRTVRALARLLSRLALDGPVVMMIEDLHWASPAAVDIIVGLSSLVESAAVVLAVTTRPGPDGPAARLLALPAGEVVVLDPLAGNDDRRLLDAWLGPGVLPVELEDELLRRGEGNPFFLEELVRSLIDSGSLARDGPGWRFSGGAPRQLPDTIERVILSRLDRLDPPVRDVLDAAAVIGRLVDETLLAVVTSAGAGLRPAVDELTRLELVRPVPGGQLGFRHALIQETAYGNLLRRQRRVLHARTAAALEERYAVEVDDYAGLLSHHHAEAGASGVAARWAERYAGRAKARLAFAESAGWYERSLTLLDSGEEAARLRLLLALGEVNHKAGRLVPAVEAFERAACAAREQGDDDGLAAAALGHEDAVIATRRPRAGRDDPSVLLLRDALSTTGSEGATGVRLLAALGRSLSYAGLPEGPGVAEQAVVAARAMHDDALLAYALLAWRASHESPRLAGPRLQATRELVAAASRVGELELVVEAERLALRDEMVKGDWAAVDDAIARLTDLIVELGQPLYFWYPAMWNAMRALYAGEWHDAQRHADTFLAEGERLGYRDALPIHHAHRFLLARETGEVAGVVHGIGAHVDAYPQLPAYRAMLALALVDTCDVASALVHLRHLTADGFSRVPHDMARGCTLALIIELAVALGEQLVAEACYPLLQPWTGCNLVLGSGAACFGSADHFLYLAAPPDVAPAHLDAALAMNAASPPWLRRTEALAAKGGPST